MKRFVIALVALFAFVVPNASLAGVVLFDQPTDTISVSGQTVIGTASTYEAQILFTGDHNGSGSVFSEWQWGAEDKTLGAGPDLLSGYNYYDHRGYLWSDSLPITLGLWHHIAFVYDGSEQRLYVDGQSIASRPASHDVRDSAGQAFIGSIYRDFGVQDGFVGYLDSLRISNVGRYSGATFTPPVGDLGSDANTLLLYNFNELPGSTTAADESSLDRTGTLGVGFAGATSPEFTSAPAPVPEPSTLAIWSLLGLCGIGFGWRRRRKA